MNTGFIFSNVYTDMLASAIYNGFGWGGPYVMRGCSEIGAFSSPSFSNVSQIDACVLRKWRECHVIRYAFQKKGFQSCGLFSLQNL